MTNYQNGQAVTLGLYVSTRPLDVRYVSADGEPLEGRAASYRRVPTLLAIALAPVLGGLFVVAFPVVIFAAVGIALYEMATRSVGSAASEHAWLARSSFQPAASYLNGSEGGEDSEPQGDEMAELDAEVDERRDSE